MQHKWSRLAGAIAATGGMLTIVVSIPPSWYGVPATDSYIFAPPMFSPFWINRTVIPVLAVLAALGLLVGLIGLIWRDWSVAGRARRWGGVVGTIAFALITVSVPTLVSVSEQAATDVLMSLVLLLVGLLGAILLVPGLLMLGYGYAKTERPRIGYAFIGVLVGAPALAFLTPGAISSLFAAVPIGIAWLILGEDLWREPGPLGAGERA